MGAVTHEKKELDMLYGSMWGKVPLFALPVAATTILEQLFNASDVAIVGNFALTDRTAAVAAVGANSPVVSLILNLLIGIALGSNVVIANAIGRKDQKEVEQAVHTSITAALLGGLIILLLGELIAAPLMTMMHVPADVYPLALMYLRIYLLGMPVILLYNFESAIFRSIGETRIPLIALAISGILNVGLNLFFVVILHMTVNGVAIATVLSNLVSALLLLHRLRRTQREVRVELRRLRIHPACLKRVLRIGLPAGLQSAVFSFANIVVQSAINSLGTDVMAGSSAGYNLEFITYAILNSFCQACTTFTGQNYGAREFDRCKKALRICLIEAALVLCAAITALLVFGKPMLSIFNNDPDVIAIGYVRVLAIVPSHLLCMLYDVTSGYLRGFGISFVPALLTLLGVCGTRLFWIQFVFPHAPSFFTIMLVYPISLGLTALLMICYALIQRPARRLSSSGAS